MKFFISWRQFIGRTAPYLSELGAVVFTAAAAFGMFAVAGEFLAPGFAINHISPKGLLAVLALSGCLALVPGRPVPVRPIGPRYVLIAAAVVVGSAAASWYYFGPLPEARVWLTPATAVTIAAVLCSAALRPGTDADR